MTTINGAKHDVEDILASIRTSIADRSPFDTERRDSHVTTLRGRSVIAEEATEFELPAIFKVSAQPAPERPNLLGRLSEALSSSGQQHDWERSRTVIPFEPAHGRMIEPPPVVLQAVNETPAKMADKVSAENDSVKRIMPTFFDTRINRMSETTRAPMEAKSEPKAKAPVAEPPHPPRLPEIGSGGMNGGVEDAAAQLLRPILKQWLTENMPKIVEKALRSETGDDEPNGSSRR